MKEGIITRFLLVFLVLSMPSIDVKAQQLKYILFESKKGGFFFQCPRAWKFEADTVKTDSSGKEADWENGRFVSTDSTEAKVYKD